jgi:hypothetical protein
MMKHVSFSPNLYTTICQFYVMFLVTFIVTCLQAAYVQTTQRRHAKNVTNLKLLTYVDCKVTSSVSEDSPESSYYSKLISRRHKRPVAATSTNSIEHKNEIHNLRVCRSVGKNKMIIGYGFKRNKNVFSLHVCTHVHIFMYRSGTCTFAGYSLHTLHVTETISSDGTNFSMLFTNLHKFTYEK